MAEARQRYVVIFKDRIVPANLAAHALKAEAAHIKVGIAAFAPVSLQAPRAVEHFEKIGVSFAWLTAAEAETVRRDDLVASVHRSFRVSGGRILDFSRSSSATRSIRHSVDPFAEVRKESTMSSGISV